MNTLKNNILTILVFIISTGPLFFGCNPVAPGKESIKADFKKLPDSTRVKNILALKWGLFLHWSLGTFSGEEWTNNVTSPGFFAATEMNTDQWCQVAKDAGMGYVIFVAKHHDGFCLWDTKTTAFKVTNSPLKKDALALLQKSCDKYGIKLCLYFSEADWTWPNMENAEKKAAQLTELFTNYGAISLIWLDVAQWDGGLDHDTTEALIKKLQPNCFIGFNHGLPAGELQSRERGTFEKLDEVREPSFAKPVLDSLVNLDKKYVLALNWREAGKIESVLMKHYNRYLVAECAVPIDQVTPEDVYWFYNDQHKNVALPAPKIFELYKMAVNSGVLFSLALGPDKKGDLRKIDVERLKEVGEMIRNQ